jgi:histidinol-phosphate aminotransferase
MKKNNLNLHNQHLLKFDRFRMGIGRDVINGLRLDRNEKVDNWPKNFYKKIFQKLPSSFWSTYPDHNSIYKKLAKFLKVKEDQILISSGMDGSIGHIFNFLTKPSDHVGVISPTYAMYYVYSKIFKTKLFKFENYKNLVLQFNNDLKIFLKKKPRVLFIPNPNQPIENYFSLKELEKIILMCQKVGCLVVIDEAYYMFGSKSSIKLIKKNSNLIVLRNFSKAFGVASARIGITVSSNKIMKLLSNARPAHEIPAPSIAVGEYLLDNIHLVKKSAKDVVVGRNYCKKELLKLNIKCKGSYGNYLLIDLKDKITKSSICKNLKINKIYIKNFNDKALENYILITVGPVSSMKKFVKILKESF